MEHYGSKSLRLRSAYAKHPPNTQMEKTQVRKLLGSSNSYFRIVAHSPNTKKVRPLTEVCNL